MIIRLDVAAALALSLVTAMGCSGSSKPIGVFGADAAGPAADTQWATNAADVARFADEVPFGPDALVAHDRTPIRKSPGGEPFGTLPAHTDVTKLASHAGEDLVCFNDPRGGAHLAGWVADSDLVAPAAPPAPDPPDTVDDGGSDPPDPRPPTPHGHHKKPRRPHR
jgi:hypothetical protein